MKVLSVVHIKSDRLPGTGLCFRTCLVSLSFRLGLDRSSWRMFWDVLARFALPVQVVGCFWVQHAFTGFSCLEATVMILEVASSSYLTAPHWTSAWWVRSPTVRKVLHWIYRWRQRLLPHSKMVRRAPAHLECKSQLPRLCAMIIRNF